MSDEVLFTQKLVSKDNDNKVTIEWMVENNTGGLIENALALSQCYTHDFGNFEDGEVKSIIFDVELPSDERQWNGAGRFNILSGEPGKIN